jgi:phosphonate transport system substrate-binding protein
MINSAWMRILAIAPILALFLATLPGCDPESDHPGYTPQYAKPDNRTSLKTYTLAVHPLHNPERLFDLYQPLVDFMNERIRGFSLRLEASRGYEDFERKIEDGTPHFLLPNPYQTLKALELGYEVMGKMAGDDDFRGIVLTLKDSGADSPKALRGRTVAFPAPSALAATMMPMEWLAGHGLLPGRDYSPLYSGSQESSIHNLLNGQAAAAATWPVPWRLFSNEHPALAGRIAVLGMTDTLPNNSLMAKACLPTEVKAGFMEAALALSSDVKGRAALSRAGFAGFERATSGTYEPVREFLARFARLAGGGGS